MKADSKKLDYIARWQYANRDRVREYKKKWRENNSEKQKSCQENYRKTNKPRIAAASILYRVKNQAAIRDYNRKWVNDNRESVNRRRRERRLEAAKANAQKAKDLLRETEDAVQRIAQGAAERRRKRRNAQSVEWKRKNKDKTLAMQRSWNHKNRVRVRLYRNLRRTQNPQVMIAERVRSRISRVLKRQRTYKTNKTMVLVGCTLEQLKTHIESQFAPGMTWDNRSLWHIDHRIPCAAFDLTKEEDQKKCFHFTNLQPLWAPENQSKGAKIIT